MPIMPYALIEPSAKIASPLIVDSPHSGRNYPADFHFDCPMPWLRQAEDSYVDELVADAADAGATLITADFPRSYIDVNRAEDDIDPAVLASPWPEPLDPSDRTLMGLGLVRRLCKSGVPMYAAPLPVAEIQKRIAGFYRPYHQALEKMIARRVQEFGEAYLIDCHSMPSQSGESRLARRPDFILGDRSGSSCDLAFTRRVRDLLQDMGYSVALNDPYKGVEIVSRYGQPQIGQHALQLEINRRLYLNEQTLEKNEGFVRIQQDMTALFRGLVAELMWQAPEQLAAE